jgi:small-conductance mechanosensitive channel
MRYLILLLAVVLPNLAAAQDEGEGALDLFEPSLSVVQQIAQITQTAAEGVADWAASMAHALTVLPQTLQALNDEGTLAVLLGSVGDLAFTLFATYGVFAVLRLPRNAVKQRLVARTTHGGFALRAAGALALFVADGIIIALSWLAGYALVLLFSGETGSIALLQTLYLNAFLVVMVARAVARLLLAPNARELRVMRLRTDAATTLWRWSGFVTVLLGYGLLLLVPIIRTGAGNRAADAFGTAVSLVAVVSLIGLVLRSRQRVSDWMTSELAVEPHGLLQFILARWWVPVVLYALSLAALILVQNPERVLAGLEAGGTAFAVGWIGLLLAGYLTRAVSSGIQLSEGTRARLPMLQTRLNTYVAPALRGVRAVLLCAILVVGSDATGLTDITAWLSAGGSGFVGTAMTVLVLVLIGFGAWLVLSSWVEYRLNPDFGSIPTAREKTLLTLLRNAISIALIIVMLMLVLSELGINIAPLIASAGVLGLAIGFGAQKMVEDIITGVFIQFENAVNVGDVVTLGGVSGVVEKLTVRSVSLRDLNGIYHVIPFSSVSSVSNFSKDFGYHVEDMGIAYREDVDDAKTAMLDAFEALRADPDLAPHLLGDLEWFGVTAFGDNAVVLRARIKTVPGQQWGVGRAYKYHLKKIFDARDIEIPFPQSTLWFGVGKDGSAPPLPSKPIPDQS